VRARKRIFPLGFAGDPSELGNPFFGEPGRGAFPRDSERWMKGALEVERLSLRELCDRNLEGGGLFYWGPRRMCKGRLWRRAFLSMGAPLGNLEGCSYTGYVERSMEGGSRYGASLSEGAL
jgi:hypothetical protein